MAEIHKREVTGTGFAQPIDLDAGESLIVTFNGDCWSRTSRSVKWTVKPDAGGEVGVDYNLFTNDHDDDWTPFFNRWENDYVPLKQAAQVSEEHPIERIRYRAITAGCRIVIGAGAGFELEVA